MVVKPSTIASTSIVARSGSGTIGAGSSPSVIASVLTSRHRGAGKGAPDLRQPAERAGVAGAAAVRAEQPAGEHAGAKHMVPAPGIAGTRRIGFHCGHRRLERRLGVDQHRLGAADDHILPVAIGRTEQIRGSPSAGRRRRKVPDGPADRSGKPARPAPSSHSRREAGSAGRGRQDRSSCRKRWKAASAPRSRGL